MSVVVTSSLEALRRKLGASLQHGERLLGQVALEPRPRTLADQPVRPLPGGLPPGTRFDRNRIHTLAERAPDSGVSLVLTDRRILVLTTSFLVTKVVATYTFDEVAEFGIRPLHGRDQLAVRFADRSLLVRPECVPHSAEAFCKAFRGIGPLPHVSGYVDPAFLDL